MAEICVFDAYKNIACTCNGKIKKICNEAVIIVYLYYLEDVSFYCAYLDKITEDIQIHIISSRDEVIDMCSQQIKRQNVTYQIKPNRGRDISALLIAAKDVISEYEYFCFIHDKTGNLEYMKDDVKIWTHSLWDNMLFSTQYILQILCKFEEDPVMGLLAAPEPYGEYLGYWYGETWNKSYPMTLELAEKLNLHIKISKEEELSVLGTVFWGRKIALKKLLDYSWNYEDFQAEPLPIEGTLSHAIERILQFVAKDAGYSYGTVMTTEYASYLLQHAKRDMQIMFSKITKKEHVFNMHQIWIIDEWKRSLIEYSFLHERLYIYGAGNYGNRILAVCKELEIQITGFIVSDGRGTRHEGQAMELKDVEIRDGDGIIVGVSYEYRKEIHDALKTRGISDYMDGF